MCTGMYNVEVVYRFYIILACLYTMYTVHVCSHVTSLVTSGKSTLFMYCTCSTCVVGSSPTRGSSFFLGKFLGKVTA